MHRSPIPPALSARPPAYLRGVLLRLLELLLALQRGVHALALALQVGLEPRAPLVQLAEPARLLLVHAPQPLLLERRDRPQVLLALLETLHLLLRKRCRTQARARARMDGGVRRCMCMCRGECRRACVV